MTQTLFDLTYQTAKLLEEVRHGLATGGTTTTLIDTNGLQQVDDFWGGLQGNMGTVWILYDAGALGAAPAAGQWIELTGYLSGGAYAEAYVAGINNNTPIMRINSTTAYPTWTGPKKLTGYSGGGLSVICKLTTSLLAKQAYFDDLVLRELIYSDLMATRDFAITDFDMSIAVTLDALPYKSQAGLVACVDDYANPANLVEAYHDGINIHLKRKVAGVYPTELINTAVTYVAGATLRLKGHRSGGDLLLDLYYNDVQVSTQKTVSDAAIVDNTRHGIFSASSLNALDSFSLLRYA